MSNTKLTQTLVLTDPDQVKLDRIIKEILANKSILARIIKEVVEECSDMSFEEIEACIEGDVQIERIPMEPGLTNTIQGSATEDSEIGEGCVYYDIRTFLRLPGEEESQQLKILLNMEAQKEDSPGYDVTERAVYYGCRMISSQLNVEFTNRADDPVKYGNIKKVYSIWLCTESAEKRANRIVRYKLGRENIFVPNGIDVDDGLRYDLMQVVMIYISKKHTGHDSENDLIRMLTDLFDEELDAQKKIDLLEKGHHLSMTDALRKEVADMCKYTAIIEEKGIEKGIEKGMQKGIQKGMQKERIEAIRNMIRYGVSKETILQDYSEEEYKKAEQNLLVNA